MYRIKVNVIENNNCIRVILLNINCEYDEIHTQVASIMNTEFKNDIVYAQSLDCEIL